MAPDIGANAPIRWLPDYAVGVQEIDHEHQGLFSMAEKLQRAIRSGGGSSILQGLLDQLVDYTVYHFAHEEELMQRIAYPHYQNHRRQHEDLRSDVHAMRVSCAAGPPNLENEIMNFLAEWLRCHTTTSDRRIGTYMRKCGLVP